MNKMDEMKKLGYDKCVATYSCFMEHLDLSKIIDPEGLKVSHTCESYYPSVNWGVDIKSNKLDFLECDGCRTRFVDNGIIVQDQSNKHD